MTESDAMDLIDAPRILEALRDAFAVRRVTRARRAGTPAQAHDGRGLYLPSLAYRPPGGQRAPLGTCEGLRRLDPPAGSAVEQRMTKLNEMR